MAGFLYYVPTDAAPTRADLRMVGFEHADCAALPGCECNKGPDDRHGWVFNLGSPPCEGGGEPAVWFKNDDQTWAECAEGKWWLGWDNEHPPTSLDLRHKTIGESRSVVLADGRAWMIPVIRERIGTTTLPVTLGLDRQGTVIQRAVLPGFARLWELTQRLWQGVMTFDWDKFTEEDLYELACGALALNYRIGKWEAGALGLLTTENLSYICAAIVDIPQELMNGEG